MQPHGAGSYAKLGLTEPTTANNINRHFFID
jgi:hypothetical protein